MKKLSKDQEVIQLVQQYFMVSSGDQKMEDATEKTINAAFNFIVSYSRFVTTSIFPFNPSYPGGWGGGGAGHIVPTGSVSRPLRVNKAMNLKFYDFSSNSIWNKGPTKKILWVKYILHTGPFVRNWWNSSVIGDVRTSSWFL